MGLRYGGRRRGENTRTTPAATAGPLQTMAPQIWLLVVIAFTVIALYRPSHLTLGRAFPAPCSDRHLPDGECACMLGSRGGSA